MLAHLIVASAAFALVSSQEQIELECVFESQTNFERETYTCDVQSDLPSLEPAFIADVGGAHTAGQDVSQVFGIAMVDRVIYRIPSNLHLQFPAATEIKIDGAPMRHLRASDLAGFKAVLIFFALTCARLEVIEAGTFEGFERLERVDLSNNNITLIEAGTFSNVPQLAFLDITASLCNDPDLLTASSTAASIADFLAQLESSACIASADVVARVLPSILEKVELDVQIRSQNSDLEAQIAEIASQTSQISEATAQLETCTSREAELTAAIDSLSNRLATLEELETANETLTENLGICQTALDQRTAENERLEDELRELEGEAEKCREANGTCRFVDDPTYGYTCLGHDVRVSAESDRVEWGGTHLRGRADDAVRGLILRGLEVVFVPRKISEVFGRLEALVVTGCGLRSIEKRDLDGLDRLTTLQVSDNQISSIQAGSFDEVLLLQTLDLSFNEISSLPTRAFANLARLAHIDLSNNRLTNIRFDAIPATNGITSFLATSNQLRSVDVSLVWRLNRASLIDFRGNACNFNYDSGSGSFLAFYNSILASC